MNRRSKQGLALLGGATLLTLAWPGASSAQTSLGGYSGVAQSAGIRVQIYEPVIPIPSNPQIDGSIGYAKASTDTGPVSRATASYLWPGDVIGDGFNQLVGNPNAKYPVQVNSRYPATSDSPAHNTAQLTDGNGMTTSSTDSATTASVTGLGVAGPGVNLLGGLGNGLGQLTGKSSSPKSVPDLPVPVSSTLAALATLENLHITSSVVVGKDTVTSSARATMSSIKLLGGLISISGMDVRSQSVSNGTKASESGSLNAMQLAVAGQSFTLGDKGVQFGGTTTKLPPVPAALSTLLAKIGISLSYAPATQSVQGATGAQSTSGLVISIDTVPLKTALNLGGLVAPLQQLIEKIPTLGSQLAPLLGLGPKIVLTLGDVSSTATAAPAYAGGNFPVTGGGTTGPTSSGGVVPAGSTGGSGGGGGLPGGSTGGTPGTGPVAPAATAPTQTQATGFELPGLGAVPRGLILGGLALAALVGWGLRLVGGFLLGGGRSCAFGLPTGVPDLRNG